MNATLLCLALLTPGYGEKDIRKGIEEAGGDFTYMASHERGKLVKIVRLPRTDTDAYLSDLCELSDLANLDLGGSTVTNDGLRLVSQLPELEALDVSDTRITDKGLRHLESMKGLKYLDLQKCPDVTAEGIARLQKALPGCNVSQNPLRGLRLGWVGSADCDPGSDV